MEGEGEEGEVEVEVGGGEGACLVSGSLKGNKEHFSRKIVHSWFTNRFFQTFERDTVTIFLIIFGSDHFPAPLVNSINGHKQICFSVTKFACCMSPELTATRIRKFIQ